MNIYNKTLFSKYNTCDFYYEISAEKHSESVYLIFSDMNEDTGEPDKEEKHIFISDGPILSSWLALFGYENNDKSMRRIFNDLKGILKIIPMKQHKTAESIQAYLDTLSADTISVQADQIWNILHPVIDAYPLLSCLYASCYEILRHFKYSLKHPEEKKLVSRWIEPEFALLSEQLTKMDKVYEAAREYCKAVFQTDNAPGGEVSPRTISYIYREYCMEAEVSDYYTKPVLKSSPKTIPIKAATWTPINIPWVLYYDYRKEASLLENDDGMYPMMHTIEDIAYAGIHYLIGTDSVLRTCKLCGKEFRTKFSSSQEYCTRLYGDTKAACNEYASRKSYKEKLFQHPIHQEFTKAYNKLYGRIRRGKLPADTPLMEQLKRLHEDYYEKYENTHLKEREAVWKEYIEKNKELLS